MSDELIQRYKRELERAGVDPAEVAYGLLGGRVFLVSDSDIDGRGQARPFTSEAKALAAVETMKKEKRPNGFSWSEAIIVEEHQLDFLETTNSERPIFPSSCLKVVTRYVDESCRACGSPIVSAGLCAVCEFKVARDEAAVRSEESRDDGHE